MSRHTVLCALAVLLAAIGVLVLLSRPTAAQGPVRQPGFGVAVDRYIVVLKEDAGEVAQAADQLAREQGLTLGLLYRRVLRGFVATIPAARLEAVRRNPRVAYVERDQPFRAFASFAIPTGVDRVDADVSATAKIDDVDEPLDVDVAIIDTGIQRDHPDLNVVGGRNFVTFGEPDDQYDDLNGHGTHVAGTVAARDNGPNDGVIHVVGVAPGARLWAVRVLDRNSSGWTSWLIAGVDWVTDTSQHPPIEVANMSLGGGNSQALNQAIANSVASGVTYAVAAGNDGRDCQNTSPANSTSDGVITVSALDDTDGQPGGDGSPFSGLAGRDDTFASFSNFGAGEEGVDIMAPGVGILSTWPGGGYHTLSGTSMASPHVAGGAALYILRHGGSPAEVKSALLAAAKPASSSEGYNGSTKDGVSEPLLYVGGF